MSKEATLYQVGLDGKMTSESAIEMDDCFCVALPHGSLKIPKEYACVSPEIAAMKYLTTQERRVDELKDAEAKLAAARRLLEEVMSR